MKYGRLEIIEPAIYVNKFGKEKPGYLCKCDCGGSKIVEKYALTSGKVKSCGCLIREFNRETKTGNKFALSKKKNKENLKQLPHYKRLKSIWRGMKTRCNNNKSKSYERYGKKGISVCEEWNSFNKFYDWAIGNGYKCDLTLDRVDVNGNYEPKNCRWANIYVQNRNKNNNHNLTINGVTKCITDWSTVLRTSCYRLKKYIPDKDSGKNVTEIKGLGDTK